jgi:mRNA-degrading endonuclease RelE of RelBE toxin-antitoxin system
MVKLNPLLNYGKVLMSINLVFTDRFKRDIRRLSKRYRSIRNDLQSLIEELESGGLPGDQISGIDPTVFKVRVKNSSIQKGKSGDYRVIYYSKTNDQIVLLTIYSKSDQSNIDSSEIREIIIDAEDQIISSEQAEDIEDNPSE